MIAGGGIDPVVALAVQLLLSAVFATAAAHKIMDRQAFRQALADYRLLPDALLVPAGIALMTAESFTAIALVMPELSAPGLSVAAILLLLYAVAIGINLMRGRSSIDCGCSVFASGQTISSGLVARNLALAAMAIVTLLMSGTRSLSAGDYGVALIAAIAFFLLYGAVNQLLANAPRLARLKMNYE